MTAATRDPIPPILASLMRRPSRVVVVRALRLGDLLCAVPALRSLRRALPHAHISLIGLPLAREFVLRCPFIDNFEEFPGYPGIADQPVDPERTLAFLARMQAAHLDLAIQLHGSGVFSNPFTRLLGARHTVGFTREGETDLGLDFTIPYPHKGREIDRLLALTQALGAPDTDRTVELTVLPEDVAELAHHEALRRTLGDGRPVVALHPGAKVATRRWMPEHFAAIGDAVSARYGASIVILGNQQEHDLCESVRQRMHALALNVAGQTSLGMVAALLARVRLLVANDSGIAHLSAAVRTPAIVIFGAAQAETWAHHDCTTYRPLSISVPCRPCTYTECSIGYRCLHGITVDAVLAEVEHVLRADLHIHDVRATGQQHTCS